MEKTKSVLPWSNHLCLSFRHTLIQWPGAPLFVSAALLALAHVGYRTPRNNLET